MFYGRAQGEEESVAEFELDLRSLALYTEHSTSSLSVNRLETALC